MVSQFMSHDMILIMLKTLRDMDCDVALIDYARVSSVGRIWKCNLISSVIVRMYLKKKPMRLLANVPNWMLVLNMFAQVVH